MISYSILDPKVSDNGSDGDAPIHRYAWLEHRDGIWHFLTDLFADAATSTRRWSDKSLALEELMSEGWAVVYPYPEHFPKQQPSLDKVCGYGLMWADH